MEEATLWQVVRATAKVSCVSAGSSALRDQMAEDLVSAPPPPQDPSGGLPVPGWPLLTAPQECRWLPSERAPRQGEVLLLAPQTAACLGAASRTPGSTRELSSACSRLTVDSALRIIAPVFTRPAQPGPPSAPSPRTSLCTDIPKSQPGSVPSPGPQNLASTGMWVLQHLSRAGHKENRTQPCPRLRAGAGPPTVRCSAGVPRRSRVCALNPTPLLL